MKFKPFAEYKNSGVEWLGKIPIDWDIEKLKFRASVKFSGIDKKSYENEQKVKLCNYVDVYYNDLITSSIEFMEATASKDEILKFTLKLGDVLVTKDSESWDDIAIPAFVTENFEDVICGYHLAQIRPLFDSVIIGKFLFWFLVSDQINYQFKISANGITRYGLSNYALSNSILIIPSMDEQRVIVSFLDRETIRIDSLIVKKQKLIELLQENRQAVINQAVTKGLNPNVKMKDSNIDWIGEIPADWGIKRIKYEISINGEVLPESTSNEKAIQYIDISGVGSDGEVIGFDEFYFGDAPSRARRVVKDGDTIVSTVRTYLKAIAYIHKEKSGFICSTGFAVLRPMKNIHNKFLYYWGRSTGFIETVCRWSVGVSYPAINAMEMGNFPIVLMPFSEQQKIADYLDEQISKSDQLELKIKIQIEKLQEYRQGLISAAVTGKIDVREEVA